MLSEQLKAIREKHGLNTEQMAYFMEMPSMAYTFFEWGDPLWDTRKLEKKAREIDERLTALHSTDGYGVYMEI